MRLRTVMAGAAVLALAACNRPQPLTDAQKTALADSVDQVAARMMASFAVHATPENYLSYYVRGNDWVHAEYGMVYPTYDSLVKAVRAFWRPGTSMRGSLSDKHFTVLSRDVVVLTAMIGATMRDSAGAEMPFREAWTAVFHRTADGWKIAADHESTAPPAATPQPSSPARKQR
jgi:hypothetical protein